VTAVLKPGRNCWIIDEVGATGLLIDGRDYYRAFYRAAMKARRYILLAGWQFDREVHLLRGDDARETSHDVRFLSFLNELCEKIPKLKIYILSWDFSSLYILDREWFQDLIYTWTTSARLYFRFDNTHSIGASHHQKFAVIDGTIGFVGGIDICSQRWDDRDHRVSNPHRRDAKGKAYEPYHDIQSCFTGQAAERLARYFSHRWKVSGGKKLDLAPPPDEPPFEIDPTVSIPAHQIALSRTRGRTLLPLQSQLQEIRNLYVDAISSADQLIYMENQYFSSQAVYQAIIERIEDSGRPPLQIVIILPKKPHTLAENVAMGLAQMKMLKDISERCEKYGHAIGIYHTLPAAIETGVNADAQWESTYIHAKLLIVDDRFLSVGSANTTNRSMGLDTELNVSWEVGISGGEELTRSIRQVRETLLTEHAGLEGEGSFGSLGSPGQLVARLDEMCGKRLRRRSLKAMTEENPLLRNLDPEKLKVDPDKPVIEENVFEVLSLDRTGLFAEGITLLSDILAHDDAHEERSGKKLRDYLRRFLSMILYALRNPWRWIILLALIALSGWIVAHFFF
jgi:phospholipase D1/2